MQLRLDEGFELSRQILSERPSAPAPARHATRAAVVAAVAVAPSNGTSEWWSAVAVAAGAGMLLQFLLQSAVIRRRVVAPARVVGRPPSPVVAPKPEAPREIAPVQPQELEIPPAPASAHVEAIEPVRADAVVASEAIAEPTMPAPEPVASAAIEPLFPDPTPPPHDQTVSLLKRLAARRASAAQPDDRHSAIFRMVAVGQMERADEALRDLESEPDEAAIAQRFTTTMDYIAARREEELQQKIDGLRGRVKSESGVRRLAVADAYLRRKRLNQAAEVLDEIESGTVDA